MESSFRQNWKQWFIAVALSLPCTGAYGEILYDNSETYLNLVHSNSETEFGDEVWLQGSNPVISQFEFEYRLQLGAAGFTGAEKAEIFLRLNDGPEVNGQPSPGTLVWDSHQFDMYKGIRTVTISGLAVPITPHFTWTVLFTGLLPDEKAGLLLYDPPTTGTSPDYFWEKSSVTGDWTEVTVDGGATPANFASRVEGISVDAPPPKVNIKRESSSGKVLISWGTGYPGFAVQEKHGAGDTWKPVTAGREIVGREYVVKVSADPGLHFFRLVQP